MNNNSKTVIQLIVFLILVILSEALPKYEENPKAYAEKAPRSRSYHSQNKTELLEPKIAATKDRLERLGYTTGYGTLNGYSGATGLSAYNPIKLDLGGVVLGTLVGIGAIIIIPKLLAAFHGGYGGYGRNEDGNNNDLTYLSMMINKIDDVLGQNNIDSTNCMQRTICGYVRTTEYNIKTGESDQIDELIHMLSENSLVDYLLDGTAIKEAVAYGKKSNAKSCEDLYPNCLMDSKSIKSILVKLLPKKTEVSKSIL
ncbi:uncharacterized protein LOC115628786 [Scaptodrosophila lebanonensis]|uniref:Uncharacterized protein LOC115628786 n=1 Tax=Drosophila lebanonensis TaxID=7225 RepID=A0A6J2TWG2_DROLE|nr:uncharacterized protein LOC115628786 [Scaptodrosophila lebanonensis]